MNTKSIISVILFALPLFLGGQIICDSCPPTVDLTADGSSAATFLWSNNDNTPTTTVSAAGSYFVTVTEPGGCPGVLEYQVSFTQPTINSIQVVDDPCFQPSVTIQVFGAFPMTIDFGNGIVVNNVTTNFTTINNSVPTGTFTATVTDANGCTATQSYTVDDGTCCTCNPQVLANGSCGLKFFASGTGCGEYNYIAERSTNGGASWSFLFSGSAPVNQNFTPNVSGLYRLRLIPENSSDCNGEIISNEFNFQNSVDLVVDWGNISLSCIQQGSLRFALGTTTTSFVCDCCTGGFSRERTINYYKNNVLIFSNFDPAGFTFPCGGSGTFSSFRDICQDGVSVGDVFRLESIVTMFVDSGGCTLGNSTESISQSITITQADVDCCN